MENGNLLKVINQEIEDFKTKRVQVVPGFSINQYEIINRCHQYYHSKFSDKGDTLDPIDEEGDRLYFQNINKNPCKVCTKSIDFDTKHFKALTVGGGDPLKTWFIERDLKYWMRDQQFGKTLNRIFREIPILGSVVLKAVAGELYFVDLRNFVVQQSSDTLNDSNYIIEIHNYSIPEFRRIGKAMKWNEGKIKEAIREFHKMKNTSHLKVIERYGEVPSVLEDGTVEYTYKRLFIADVGEDEFDQRQKLRIDKVGVILGEEEWEGHPYWEIHMEKLPGRWLGIGVVETLFENQIRINELTNLQAKASYWAALRLWQTTDSASGGKNLNTDHKNGDVLTVDSLISPVDMADRNLAFFNDQYSLWFKNRDENVFSQDVVQGDRLPAGTPLGSAQIAQQNLISYFEGIQEDIALAIKEMIYGVILPRFEKEQSTEHTLRLVGEDLDQYTQMIKNDLVAKQVVSLAIKSLSGGHFPTAEERDTIGIAVEESIKQGKEKLLTIPKDFYKGLKYDIDIDITGESVDTRVRSATRLAVLQAITADPTALQDPIKKKFLAGMLEDNGISSADLFGVETKTVENVAPVGGGVSAPQMGMPVPGKVPSTV